MIYLDNATKSYKKNEYGIKNVSLNIENGEFVCIVGYSGAGKTTLLKLISGEIKPTVGKVFYKGKDISTFWSGEKSRFRRKIGMIFQDFRLLPDKSIFENIAFAMEVAGKSQKQINNDVPYVMALVGLTNKADKFPHELSGGEKQRVAIARAMINNPEVLIADEPTGNLDPYNSADIIAILKKINELGTTVLLSTHDAGVVNELKTRVITVKNAEIYKDEKNGSYLL